MSKNLTFTILAVFLLSFACETIAVPTMPGGSTGNTNNNSGGSNTTFDGTWTVEITNAHDPEGKRVLFAEFFIRISGGRAVEFGDPDDATRFTTDGRVHEYPIEKCDATYTASASLSDVTSGFRMTIAASVESKTGSSGEFVYRFEGTRTVDSISGSVTGTVYECLAEDTDYEGNFEMVKG